MVTDSDNERLPVRWHETRRRTEYDAEYVTIGSMPGLIKDSLEVEGDDTVRKLLCDSLVLSRRSREMKEVDEYSRFVSALFLKLLQRGRMPLPTLEIERAAINAFDRDQRTRDLSETDGGELGWESKSGRRYKIDPSKFISRLSQRSKFELEDGFVQDSPYELLFITQWVSRNLGEDAGHWITPQAPLEKLLDSSTNETRIDAVDQRVDFLVHRPCRDPFVVEIDGPEHRHTRKVDQQRDSSLKRSTGIDVIRVTHQEFTPGPSTKLDEIKGRFRDVDDPNDTSGHERIVDFAQACSIASKIQFIIARAVSRGWLSGDEWNLDISVAGPAVPGAVLAGAVLDGLRTYSAYDLLYGGKSRPDRCSLRTEEGDVRAWQWEEKGWSEIEGAEFAEPCLSILVEPNSSPYDELVPRDVDFIVRPAFLPVEFRVDLQSDFPRKSIEAETPEVAEPALKFFLQNVFRKRNFRQGQSVAIWRTLRQEDTIVLLPTGGGKSIIYQLSGLLMPGITMVIDPIVALIEDQVEVLHRYGIDRVTGISSALGQTERQTVLRRAESGDFQFMLMAPERLQSPEFRATVRTLRSSSLINLAVIDEAHCVSEWGHDFRPAYLRLADTLRAICIDKSDEAPPLLALTGTASRTVLRDMMIELDIDQSQSDAVVRPDSFDREELRFEILSAQTSKEGMDTLKGVVKALPQKFREPSTWFFQPRRRDTSSGIVFIRTVKPQDWGLKATRDAVSNATGAKVVIYSGGTVPQGQKDWEQVKRQNARKFKNNEVPILVATKAFGMGIDKPNIRFVIHNGMPGSIESFYQEAGRAGRDGKIARCIVVFAEFDRRRSDRMLNPSAELEQVKRIYESEGGDWDCMDDVTSAIYFHTQSFVGVALEIDQIKDVVEKLGTLAEKSRVKIPWGGEKDQRSVEYAIVRLVRVGVIAGYAVDWNRNEFIVDVSEFNFRRCKDKVIEYARLAQPQTSRPFVGSINSMVQRSPRGDALRLAEKLTEFIYDSVEKSRRRAIQEAVLLARAENKDVGIRRRILDYLQDGVHAERIKELVDNTRENLEDWYEVIEKMQTGNDAGGLRGDLIPELMDHSEDPGLLFARAASETMCSNRDDRASWTGFADAIQAAIKNKTNEKGITDMIRNLYEFGETRTQAQVLRPLLTMGLLELDSTAEEYRLFRLQAYEYARNSQHPETTIAASTFALNEAVERAADMVNGWRVRYSNKCLQLLGVTKG